MNIPPRFAHQEQTFQRQLNTDCLFDTSDPGTGKTRVQLDAFEEHRKNGGKCGLVLAPKSLLYPAWVEDAKKFTPNLKISVATAPNREKYFEVEADLYITNSDAATWLARQDSTFFDRFDTIIIDEITYFKNPDSKRSRAIASIIKYFDRRFALTGTPNPNHITDIWHPVYLLDDGQRLGERYYAFRHVTCDPVPLYVPGRVGLKKWVPKPGIEFQIAQLIADINIRHKFEDCVDIPPTHTTHLRYDLNKKSRIQYEDLRRSAVLALQEGYVLGTNKAVLMNKLFQACSGTIYTETKRHGIIDSQRTDILVDLIRDREHSVVFYQWEHQRDYLLKRLKKEGISTCVLAGSAKQRQQIVRRFQNGLYRVFLAHPQSSGYGLTLTRANSTIWASLTWNLEHFIQGNYRVPRAGQTKKTETVIVTAKNTIEEEVFKRLMAKDASQSTILGILEQLTCIN